MKNANDRKDHVSKSTTNKLRDVKSKMGSRGKTGKKQEMIDGILTELAKLVENYSNNNHNDDQGDNCDIDTKINDDIGKQELDADQNDDDIYNGIQEHIDVDSNEERENEIEIDVDVDIKEDDALMLTMKTI